MKPHSGGTSSNNTGPSSASEGSNYIYTETSDGCGSHPYTFFLRSPEFDFSGACLVELVFNRHMYGGNIGTMSVYASTNGGASWSAALWTLSGDQGDVWVEQSIDLSTYAGETSVYLEWRYTGTGNGGNNANFEGDAAIDNVNITGVATPVLTIDPASLDFGFVASGGTSSEMTYELSGSCLSPAASNITVTARLTLKFP